MSRLFIIFILFQYLLFGYNVNKSKADKFDQGSGGQLSPKLAAYDVTFYDLDLNIHPDSQTIAGSNTIHANVIHPLDQLILHFDHHLNVDSILVNDTQNNLIRATFKHIISAIIIDLPVPKQTGDKIIARVFYHGIPYKASNPPWKGGFTWKKTVSGAHWVGVACQNEGADIWWPCKDHPSDEPDSMSLRFTVPEDLVCVSNGKLRSESQNNDGTKTYHWFVSTPINNYGISLYIGPYKTIQTNYESVTGEIMPVTFWYITEINDLHKKFFPFITRHLRFLEKTLGPYPFRSDKYGVAETTYLGMEHQTIIAYGDLNSNREHIIHFHELAHEWWGNMITASDWKDLWIHEGFATYMEALYDEAKYGLGRYLSHFKLVFKQFRNEIPLAPRESKSINEIYGNEVYLKGAYVLHSLRYLIGKDALLKSFREFLYPDSSGMDKKDSDNCRLVSSEDFIQTVEKITNKELDWFFEAYLRTAALPKLYAIYRNDELELYWNSKDNPDFFMPLEIVTAKDTLQIDMSQGRAIIPIAPNTQPQIDPQYWVLKETVTKYEPTYIANSINQQDKFFLNQNYPNPFNGTTRISYYIPMKTRIKMNVYNIQGVFVRELINVEQNKGWHSIQFPADNLPSGIYFYKLETKQFSDTKSFVLLR